MDDGDETQKIENMLVFPLDLDKLTNKKEKKKGKKKRQLGKRLDKNNKRASDFKRIILCVLF